MASKTCYGSFSLASLLLLHCVTAIPVRSENGDVPLDLVQAIDTTKAFVVRKNAIINTQSFRNTHMYGVHIGRYMVSSCCIIMLYTDIMSLRPRIHLLLFPVEFRIDEIS